MALFTELKHLWCHLWSSILKNKKKLAGFKLCCQHYRFKLLKAKLLAKLAEDLVGFQP